MRSLFIVLIFTAINAWSNPLEVTETDKQIDFFTFNGETEKAELLLNEMISKNPDSPKYYALKTSFYFYSRYIGPRTANSNDSLRSLILIDGQKAIDLAEQNYEVFLVEKKPTIGGKMAMLDRTFPTDDCSI